MADYYSALARAVSKLAVDNVRAREELYEHAQAVLVGQLHRLNPKISPPEIMLARAELEAAITRLEAEHPVNETHMSGDAASTSAAAIVADDHGTVGARFEPSRKDGAKPQLASKAKIGSSELAGIPGSLGAMLIGIAIGVGMISFMGVIYVRSRIGF
jgi:hypothetical protein